MVRVRQLLQERHSPHVNERARPDAIEVDAAGQPVGVDHDLVPPHGQLAIDERLHAAC